MDRRDFIRTSAVAGGALGLGVIPGLQACAQTSNGEEGSAPRALRMLILGGTGFIGPHTIASALDRGHTVAMFNRGRTNPDLFPEVERLVGDRNSDLSALEGREWDVVIDNHATNPRWVRDSAQLLKDNVGHYIFISTLSVYSDNSVIGLDEDTGATFYREGVDLDAEADDLDYGTAKSIAEYEAERAFPGRTTVIRPGLIVGPRDRTDRFSYWPVRIARGGDVLAPGDGTDPTQFIDARDLSDFSIRMAEEQVFQTINAVGPADPMPMQTLLEGIKEITESDATLHWAPADFLAEQGVRPWSHMPVWVPSSSEMMGFSRFSNERAQNLGLTFRPLENTVSDLLEWYATRPEEERNNLRAGLSPEREAEVLAALAARGG